MPDGSVVQGIQRHTADQHQLTSFLPDLKVVHHPIKVAQGDWTAVVRRAHWREAPNAGGPHASDDRRLTAMAPKRPTPDALPIAGRRPERRDAAINRARILEAARRLLEKEGFDSVSLERVAEEAGVGKGTVYRRFGDWSGLTAALLEENARPLQDAFTQGPPPLGPGAAAGNRLLAFFDAYLAWVNAHLEIALAAEVAAPATFSEVAASLILHIRSLLRELAPESDDLALATIVLGAVAPVVVARLRRQNLGLARQQAEAQRMLRGVVGARLKGTTRPRTS
jgi:AcrR family transcriptional regulator